MEQEDAMETHDALRPEEADDGGTGSSELDSEDDWWTAEAEKLVAEDEEVAQTYNSDSYRAQFMDEQEMRRLRLHLRTSEVRVENNGHLREYVPRKPPPAPPGTAGNYRRRTPRSVGNGRPQTSSVDGADTDPFVLVGDTDSSHRVEYDDAFRREVYQVRELQARYHQAKRLLLDRLDLLCSVKPSERATGSDVYENVESLLGFVAKCTV